MTNTLQAAIVFSVPLLWIGYQLHQTRKENKTIMAQLDSLDAAITALEGTETTAAATITAALNDLTAKLNSVPGNPVDATPEIARIQAVADALNQVAATATTDDPGPTPPAGS